MCLKVLTVPHCVRRLKHKGVFELIVEHKLYGVIHSMIEELMDLNAEQTLALLLDGPEKKICRLDHAGNTTVPPETVIERLASNKLYLYLVSRRLYEAC